MNKMVSKWLNKATQDRIPIQASLELTHRCNERCRHCYIDDFSDDEKKILKTSDWYSLLEELKELGTLYLILMGGEPTLHPDFFSLATKASSLGFATSFISNGMLFSDIHYAKKVARTGIQTATISFYSLDHKVHDYLTQVKGSAKKTQQAIENLRSLGINVTVNCLLTRHNIEDYFELADWCIERDIEIKGDLNITPKFDGDLAPAELRASFKQIKSFYATLCQKWPKGTPKPNPIHQDDYVCNVGKGKMAISPEGDILTCIEIRTPLGNIKENSLVDIWKQSHLDHLREMKISDLPLSQIEKDSFSYCDFCPGISKHEVGDYKKIPTFSRKVAEIKREFSNVRI